MHASAAAVQRNTESSVDTNGVGRIRVPRVAERAALVGNVEHRRDAVLHERAPDRVVVRMRQRATVDERRRNHRQVHAVPLESFELGCEPLCVAQSEVRDGMHLAAPVGAYRAAPPVPCSHVRVQRGEIGVERALPHQTEVREHHRFVHAHHLETVGACGGIPVVARQLVVVAHFGRHPGADPFVQLAELRRLVGVLYRRPTTACGRAT